MGRLGPGHPVYERLKREWQRELAERQAANGEAVVQEINAKLERIIARRKAALERDES